MSRFKTAALLMALALGVLAGRPVYAADLGGACCSDLEERVAELEATVAKKGNRKVSLTISGQINEAWTYTSIDGFSDHAIGNNGGNPSTLKIAGQAQIVPNVSAGYVLEVNISELGILGSGVSSGSEPLTRQSFFWLKSDKLGTVSLGRQALATNFFNNSEGFSTNSAWLANKPLSFGTLSDLYLTGVDVPFDGGYRNTLKYVSPEIYGFTLSATWGPTTDALATDGTGNGYDVALRYDSKDTLKDFAVKGAVGYRHSTDFPVDILHIVSFNLPTGDVNTITALGSVMHVPTGIFVNGEFVNQDWDTVGFTLKGYDVTAGLHRNLVPLGATEVFGSWGRVSFEPDGYSSTDVDYYGLGATQSLDAAAMHLYLGWRHYNTEDVLGTDADVVNAGAVVKF